MKKSKKKSSLPKSLPDCILLNTLAKRKMEYAECPFDFVATLDEFRKSVSQVIRNINILFPEYTPHDEEYHLKRLFSVADIILGDDLIESMNLVELFVLSCALYGHDWGMAVSEKEKECILKRIPVPADAEFYLLEDEFTRLDNFKKENGLDPSQIELPIELWRDYVRLTHAYRSAERIKKYFEKCDRSLSEAIARVCEGHCLDFEAIQDQISYPQNYSTLKESINLRAITIYLRLIDYFDLSDDRTPYLLWKYVSPKDPMSIKEWNKHRSLNHITSSPYQNGRIIVVDGSTNNYEVYASLMDLKDSIENEFRQCMDALAYMNDEPHKLDIYKIQWRVRSIGFKPIEIKFEFMRERMFEILSKEIYQGDPYVFLRELLQNSIDAIRFRKGILKRNGIETNNIGKIEVKSELLPTGDYLVTWQDDGIGMDEYIVKNYLAMAGKSFYRSNDFTVANVQMEPISKYGIGILSCFMVADSLEITTKREPYLSNSNTLRIYIPAIDKQFRIEEKKDLSQVGTTIKLYISKNKLLNSLKDGNGLQVTKYLEEIAGFVEFPILISEEKNKSIIAHPKADDNELKRYGKEYAIKKLSLTMPWDLNFQPHHIAKAKELFKEVSLPMNMGQGIDDGIISYLVPVSEDHIFIEDSLYAINGKLIFSFDTNEAYKAREKTIGIAKSSIHNVYQQIYVDGILVPHAKILDNDNYHERLSREVFIIMNLKKSNKFELSISRTEIENQIYLDDIVINHIYDSSISPYIESIQKKSGFKEFWYFRKTITEIPYKKVLFYAKFPKTFILFSFMRKEGIHFADASNLEDKIIYQFPSELITLVDYDLYFASNPKEIFKNWEGDDSLIINDEYLSDELSLDLLRVETPEFLNLSSTHFISGIRFLIPPWEDKNPFIQQIWSPIPKSIQEVNYGQTLEKLQNNDSIISDYELHLIWNQEVMKNFYSAKFCRFTKPYAHAFCCLKTSESEYETNETFYNIENAKIKYFTKCFWSMKSRINKGEIGVELISEFEKVIKSFDTEMLGSDVINQMEEYWKFIQSNGLYDVKDLNELIPTKDEIIVCEGIKLEDHKISVTGKKYGMPIS